jgi:uncharacterized protein YoxC
MLDFFRQKKTQEDLERLHLRLGNSFANVRSDISRLTQTVQAYNQWINYLHNKIQFQEAQLNELMHNVRHMPKSDVEVKRLIEEHYQDNHDLDRVNKRVEELHQRVDDMLRAHSPVVEQVALHHERISRLESGEKDKKPNFREKIVQKISRNSKEYIKGLMLSLIRKYEKVSAMQLREIVVEEQGLCSRSSFYRLLSELESSNEVETIDDGRERYYLHKAFAAKRHD